MALDRTCFGLPLHLSVFAVTGPSDKAAMASIGDRKTQAFSEACVFLSLLFQNVIFAAS
jgi:hypothetical protein